MGDRRKTIQITYIIADSERKSQVESSQKILKNKTTIATAIEKKLNNPIAIAIEDKEIDLLLSDYSHIICNDYKAWYAKMIKSIGAERFVGLAKTAEQEGSNPARYFSWLLKREVG